MNIYIHVEISMRELDSKLLLAILAASKGHQVIVSDIETILSATNKHVLTPGIFHTKSLTPTKKKIIRHQMLKDKGFLITSLDEEAGLDIEDDYKQFAKTRYSEKTVEHSSLIFCWGSDDTKGLKKYYPQYSSKIFETGSPRVDLWKPIFSDYWITPSQMPKKPFLLISSNMGASNNNEAYYKVFSKLRLMRYFDRDPELLDEKFGRVSEQYLTIAAFIKAIRFISKNSSDYDIVMRPHPTENIEAWKVYLEDLPNVHVIREDTISAWINNAFAVMHNGCTTAFEATISEKPLISYVSYKQKYSHQLANKLGYRVETEHELLDRLNKIFNSRSSLTTAKLDAQIPQLILNKISINNNEHAVEKIVKIWETLDSEQVSKPFSLIRLKLHLKVFKIKQIVVKILKNLFPSKLGNYEKNYKFAPLNKNDVIVRINRLIKLLKLNEKVTFEVLSDRAVLIKKN